MSNFDQHPRYDSGIVLNDIALIKLSEPINFSEKISPICLPSGKIK